MFSCISSFGLACGLLMATAGPPEADLARFEAAETHMGVQFRVIVYAADRATAEKGFSAAFARIAELDGKLSDYKDDSELNRLTGTGPHEKPVAVSEDLWRVLRASKQLSERTEGAFDVTIGPLSKLWRTARKEKRLPPAEELSAAKMLVGSNLIDLCANRPQVRLLKVGMQLDMGGIAKGFAADEALKVLRGKGLSRSMVAASGDIALGDAPPGKAGWTIAVAPLEVDQEPSQFLTLANCGVSTSGDSRQFVEIDGRRYSHILDPRTGLGISHRLSVTTVAPTAMLADSLATASYVLGPIAGLALCDETPDVAAMIVALEGGKQVTRQNKRMLRLLPGAP